MRLANVGLRLATAWSFGTISGFVILSSVPTKFVLFTLAVETAGYLYKVPLRALHLSDNNFVGTVLSAAKDQPPALDSCYWSTNVPNAVVILSIVDSGLPT
jgi:hypothetical protein